MRQDGRGEAADGRWPGRVRRRDTAGRSIAGRVGAHKRMAENARAIERDDEMRAMPETKVALAALNQDRGKRGKPPLTLAEYMARHG